MLLARRRHAYFYKLYDSSTICAFATVFALHFRPDPPRPSVIRTPYSIYWSRNLKLYQVQSADDRLDKGLRFHVSKS